MSFGNSLFAVAFQNVHVANGERAADDHAGPKAPLIAPDILNPRITRDIGRNTPACASLFRYVFS